MARPKVKIRRGLFLVPLWLECEVCGPLRDHVGGLFQYTERDAAKQAAQEHQQAHR